MVRIRTERDQKREERKLIALDMFVGEKEALYTNQVAKKLRVVWPTADRLLQELVVEGRLTGDKNAGYLLYQDKQPVKLTLREKLKRFFHA